MLKFIHPQFYPVNTILINIRHIKLYFIISAQNTKLVARHLTIVNCEMNCFYIEFQKNQIKTIYLCAVNVQYCFGLHSFVCNLQLKLIKYQSENYVA